MSQAPVDVAGLIAQVVGTLRRGLDLRAALSTRLRLHRQQLPTIMDEQGTAAAPPAPSHDAPAPDRAGRPNASQVSGTLPRVVRPPRGRSEHDYNYFTELNEAIARLRAGNGSE